MKKHRRQDLLCQTQQIRHCDGISKSCLVSSVIVKSSSKPLSLCILHSFMMQLSHGIVYRDCIGCFPILPYIRKFQFSVSVYSTSTNLKVKITIKINPFQKFDAV